MNRTRSFIIFAAVLGSVLVASPAVAGQGEAPVVDGKWDWGPEGFSPQRQPPVTEASPRTVQLLAEAVGRARTAAERAVLVHDLGLCGQSAAQAAVEKAAADPDPTVRSAAAKAAGNLGDTTPLQSLATDPDASVRREAVLAAGATGERLIVAAALEDRDESVVAAALRSVATADEAEKVAGEISRLPAALQPFAADAVGRAGTELQAARVEPLLGGGVAAKVAAIKALARLKATASMSKVRPLLSDANPAVRREAVAALGGLASADERQSSALKSLGVAGSDDNPGDPDRTVRAAAARVFQAFPWEKAVPALASQLRDDDVRLHDAARDALVATGGGAPTPVGIGALTGGEAAGSDSPAAGGAGGAPAEGVATAAVEAVAASLLAGSDRDRQMDGIFIIDRLRSGVAVTRMGELLEIDPDPLKVDAELIAADCLALGRIGPKATADVAPLRKVLAWAEVPVKLPGPSVASGPPDTLNRPSAAAPALYALARLGSRDVLQEVPPLLPLPPPLATWPGSDLRTAGVWAVGILADPANNPADKKLVDALIKMLDVEQEDTSIKLEAVKALGNLHYAPAAEVLKRFANGAASEADPNLQWMAHAALDRITGAPTPYTPPARQRIAPDVSIKDLAPEK